MTGFQRTIDLLRALGEPTRCRVLALLSQGELTVGEIAEVVEQSQPRISRHLKVLSEVGVLDRFREEQRVYYRLATSGDAADLTRAVLDRLTTDAKALERDRRRLVPVLEMRVRSAEARWEDARRSAEVTYGDEHLVRALLDEVGPGSLGELLDVGTGRGNMLRILAPRAAHAVGVDISAQALRLARAKVHGSGLRHCVFRRGDMYDLPFDARTFDAVSMDHVLSTAERPIVALREAARTLRRGGRMIVIDDARRLAIAEDAEPASVLRRWFKDLGARCETVRALSGDRSRLVLGLARLPEARA